MTATPIDQAKSLLNQIAVDDAYLKTQNASLKKDNAALAAENASLKAQLKGKPTPTPAPLPTPPPPVTSPKFQLVLDEQFAYADGPAAKRLRPEWWWEPYDGVPGTAGVGMRNGGLATIRNGNLVIAAQRPSNTSTDYNEWLSTGCAMGPIAQVYGRWEIRAKMSPGAGFWHNLMLWMTDDDFPEGKEIDIVETPLASRLQGVSTIHYDADNKQSSVTTIVDCTQWHAWSVDCTPDLLLIACDGAAIWRVTDKAMIPTTPHHLVAQTDMGSWAGTAQRGDPTRVELEIDWVKQYAFKP